jgi:hypothetical protein
MRWPLGTGLILAWFVAEGVRRLDLSRFVGGALANRPETHLRSCPLRLQQAHCLLQFLNDLPLLQNLLT